MGFINCFCSSSWKKKNDKGKNTSVRHVDKGNNNVETLHVELEHLGKTSEATEIRSNSFVVPVPFGVGGSSKCKVKVMNHESPIAVDVDYEGGDEHDDILSMKRDHSDLDLQALVQNSNGEQRKTFDVMDSLCSIDVEHDIVDDKMWTSNTEEGLELSDCGHVSDPGKEKTGFWASPELKRSCSNLEMRNNCLEFAGEKAILKSKSYENMQKLAEMYREEVLVGNGTSPASVMTRHSADKVMLKKHSSSQILPSKSRRLWWKLFLWSHRNLHGTAKPQPIERNLFALNQQGGYSSDTLEPSQVMESTTSRKSCLSTRKSLDKGKDKVDGQSWDGFRGVSGMWPQNQWVAFPSQSSPLSRVDEWVKEVSAQVGSDDYLEDGIIFPPSPENDSSPTTSSSHLARHQAMCVSDEISHANSVVQSLNASSNVAHITGIGLKVVPFISHFTSLRSVNLSGNFIVHITPGSLPKGLHVLDLSRNKINTIEGLRELTRLRVLDLSYNRITRIGQGLSNCTLIKELYLAGNKVSDVEGLHRLLKLTILDLSFNKITTTKALGQLVANYSSLIALNLLGNPIHGNISEDQLRKTLCSLLPKLAFLNKQPINPQKAREVHGKAIAKAALGSSGRSTRRKPVKRVSQGSSSPCTQRSSASAAEKSRHRSRSRSLLVR